MVGWKGERSEPWSLVWLTGDSCQDLDPVWPQAPAADTTSSLLLPTHQQLHTEITHNVVIGDWDYTFFNKLCSCLVINPRNQRDYRKLISWKSQIKKINLGEQFWNLIFLREGFIQNKKKLWNSQSSSRLPPKKKINCETSKILRSWEIQI